MGLGVLVRRTDLRRTPRTSVRAGPDAARFIPWIPVFLRPSAELGTFQVERWTPGVARPKNKKGRPPLDGPSTLFSSKQTTNKPKI